MTDAINPDHYKRLPVEAIEIIEAMIEGAPDNKAAYLHGQAAKYELRLWEKGKSLEDFLTDWGKHIWYALRLESHLLELIEKQKKIDEQKAADQQSLKDYPFGKMKWTPKIGDWVRIRKPSDTEASASSWWTSMDKYNGQVIQVTEIDGYAIIHHEWAFEFDWLEPAKAPEVAGEVTAEVTGEVKPPDGWRFLEVGEILRRLDASFCSNNVIYELNPEIAGRPVTAPNVFIRRNRFEVGEKVVRITENDKVYEVLASNETGFAVLNGFASPVNVIELAPYIEDAT